MGKLVRLVQGRVVRRFVLAIAALPVLAYFAWWVLAPLDPDPYVRVAASGRLLDTEGESLFVSLSAEESWSLPVAGKDISPYLVEATVAAEDQRFLRHFGVDPLAIIRASGQNIQAGGIASGASTLTMQLIKLGGHDSATIRGKLGQAVSALRLEKALGKDAILTAYLNRAPYGMNLIGAEAAAWRYFGKSVQALSLSEAALLAGLPKAPSRLNPLSHPDRARARRDYVLGRMCADGYIDEGQRERAMATPVRATWHEFPRHAPHLGTRFRSTLAEGKNLSLTLDGDLQRKLEALLPHYLKRFNNAITNGAILVADVQTGAVLARVGSANFENTPGGGQVDACRALRSPGSTLKPFLYGLAMDQQQLYPTEVLLDDKLDYGRYAPGNFDGEFNGPVTATEALRYSLNVPAVALLDRVGVPTFHQFLRRAALTSVDRSPADYGLGLALGNCEVSLESLARLYLSVASLGDHSELRLHPHGPPTAAEALFPPEIARVLYDMLAQPFPRESGPALQRRNGNEQPVCWKTGTSTGYHDAWTFAFNRNYLVGVWVGNNSGRGARQLVGARAALPLAAKVFRRLPAKSSPSWPPPLVEGETKICAASGLPTAEICPERISAAIPATLWRHRRCTLHVTSKTGLETAATLPGGAASWDLATLPSHTRADGEFTVHTRALRIGSPPNSAAYLLSGAPGGDQIRLSLSEEIEDTAHWFVDGRYLGHDGDGTPLEWPLEKGTHTVAVQLADGRQDTATFSVMTPEEAAKERLSTP
jgi:penicillin-binding protein 1C